MFSFVYARQETRLYCLRLRSVNFKFKFEFHAHSKLISHSQDEDIFRVLTEVAPEAFYKKGVLKTFANFTEKNTCA